MKDKYFRLVIDTQRKDIIGAIRTNQLDTLAYKYDYQDIIETLLDMEREKVITRDEYKRIIYFLNN